MSYSLAVIGAAGHTGYVLDHLGAYPQVSWCACAPSFTGEDLGPLTRRPNAVPAPRLYEDWRALLAAESPDIVVVCGRFDLNGPIALESIRRGCHVISEKPAALTLDGVGALRRAVAERAVQYTLMLGMRYEPAYYAAHELVRKGVIGEPYLISGQKSYRWGARPEWYADAACYGNTMCWVGIHIFDLARWVSGVEFTAVGARHANLVHRERPACQDSAAVLASLANGGSGAFTLDYLRPDAAATHGDDRLRIAGSHGVLEVCDRGKRLHVTTKHDDIPCWPVAESGRDTLGDMLAAIERRGDLLVPAEEGWRITEFAITAAHAAETGEWLPC